MWSLVVWAGLSRLAFAVAASTTACDACRTSSHQRVGSRGGGVPADAALGPGGAATEEAAGAGWDGRGSPRQLVTRIDRAASAEAPRVAGRASLTAVDHTME